MCLCTCVTASVCVCVCVYEPWFYAQIHVSLYMCGGGGSDEGFPQAVRVRIRAYFVYIRLHECSIHTCSIVKHGGGK
jgi:hypothetical protein